MPLASEIGIVGREVRGDLLVELGKLEVRVVREEIDDRLLRSVGCQLDDVDP